MNYSLLTVITVSCGILFSGCQGGTGFQGGTIPVEFTGIETAIAISPETIKLYWSQYPGSNQYNVYTPDANTAIAQPTFNTYLFTPVPLDPLKTYQYSVSAKSPTTGLEVGERTNYHSVQLLPHFNFKNTGSIVAVSKNAVQVSWTAYPSVTYKVYMAERMPTGSVNYNQFVATSIPAVTGVGSALVTGLLEGHEYCAIVVASYLDSKNDGPDGVLFTGDIGTTLSSNSYMVNPLTNNFNGSVISQSQHCTRTQSDFSVANLKIYAPKATFTDKPIFYVSVPGDAIAGDNVGPAKTEIYKYDEATGFATNIGQTLGSGTITAQSSISQGRYKFFAVATDMTNAIQAQAVVEIIVGNTGTTPATDLDRQYVYIRSYSQTEDPLNPVGYFPEKQQGGLGSQREGQAVALGDFNCDGKEDVAIGVPNASLMANDNRPAQQGKVVVYYDVGDATPATTTKVQEITFDITSFAGEPSRNLRLGTKLQVANFNNDNQSSNQYGAGLNANFECKDLVIGSGYGPMFVLYGKRDSVPSTLVTPGSGDGGLNFINSTSYSQNPSSSCDPTSGVCSPSIYYTNSITTQVGIAMTTGDFNGDGYVDLAASSSSGIAGLGIVPKGIWAFRGSEYGLIAPTSFNDGTDVVTTTPGPYPSFPFIPVQSASHVYHVSYAPTTPVAAPTPFGNWGDFNFGISISSMHNAYYDLNGALGTKRVRDVLLIGNPNNAMVNVCIPKSNVANTVVTPVPTFAHDAGYGLYWDCSEKILDPTAASSSFGYAMTDIKNALRYRPEQFKETGCNDGDPNCTSTSTKMGLPSAVAISDLDSGKVYLYYMVAKPGTNMATRDLMGLDRNNHFLKLLQGKRLDNTSLLVTSDAPCNITGVPVEYCDIQQITHPTSSAGNFGQVLNVFPGNVDDQVLGQAKDSILAIAAPYKNFTASGGYTYTNVGSVQLYKQNSTFANNPFVVSGTSVCAAADICRYSDGFSNSLTTALDYDGPSNNNIYFGLGGTVGGPITYSSDQVDYNVNSDIVIGAPGYVVQTVVSGSNVNVIDNGAAFTYWSHGGTFRTFQTSESGPLPSIWHTMSKSFAQESDFKFHEAVSIGDVNQDGIDDVAVRINRGYANSIRIYNGSTSKVGVDTSQGGYTNFQVQADSSGGMRFVPAGKLSTGQFPLFFVTGQNQSYLFSSGIGGIVNGVPTAFGVAGTPRKLFSPGNYFDVGFGSSIGYLGFRDSVFYNPEVVGNLDTTLNNLTPFAHGDFNGDGYEDFAMGMNTRIKIADLTKTKGCVANGFAGVDHCGDEAGVGNGRVVIFYGGENNGFQVQPDVNGGFPLNSNYFQDYSADTPTIMNYGAPYANAAPCLTDGTGCKIQVIHENNTNTFGATITSVPVGTCTNNGVQVQVSALAVQAVKNSGTPLTDIYLYKPACLDDPGNNSGLKSFANDKTLAMAANLHPYSAGSGTLTSSTLGSSMVAVGDPTQSPPTTMGSTDTTVISHLVVSDQTNRRIYIHPVYPMATAGLAAGQNFGHYDDTINGGREINYTSSVMVSAATGASLGFGVGMSKAGDLNGDGFQDIAIGMTSLPRRDINTSTPAQGAILLMFGGSTGAQSHSSGANVIEPSRSANCYLKPNMSTIDSICNPSLVYLPQATNSIRDGAYERSFISPYALMNFGNINEGLGSILMGVPGKDSLDQLMINRILQGGAFYVGP